MEQVLGIKTSSWGNAVDYWTNPAVLAHFDKVADRRDGDILIWGDDRGNWTGPQGHIAISYQGRILNQNFGGTLQVSINDFFSPGYKGALRPKGGDIPMEEIQKLWEALDASNKDKDQLWVHLNETNKNVDAVVKEVSQDQTLINNAFSAVDTTNKRVDTLEGKKTA
ncbi:hypothetical protein DVS77_21520 [Mycolicibacterium moriokaense]|nr:hypothetical protein DVS77_21520 [Mycolicibacterium moriokaense]